MSASHRPYPLAAFLRGLNLGRRRLRMTDLRRHVEALGFRNVETFIASGNLVFDSDGTTEEELERRIERGLRESLGYDVDTFVRGLDELQRIASAPEIAALNDDWTPHVIFLKFPLDRTAAEGLSALETPDDRFPVLGREILWLRRGRLSDSAVAGRDLARAVGGATSTMRNLNTIERIVEKFMPAGA